MGFGGGAEPPQRRVHVEQMLLHESSPGEGQHVAWHQLRAASVCVLAEAEVWGKVEFVRTLSRGGNGAVGLSRETGVVGAPGVGRVRKFVASTLVGRCW